MTFFKKIQYDIIVIISMARPLAPLPFAFDKNASTAAQRWEPANFAAHVGGACPLHLHHHNLHLSPPWSLLFSFSSLLIDCRPLPSSPEKPPPVPAALGSWILVY
jgi:hypothetical protein